MKIAAAIDRRAALARMQIAVSGFHDAPNGVANGWIAANHLH